MDKIFANNKKATFDYFIEDTYQVGIVLIGSEIKSVVKGNCSIKESFIRIENGEVFIHNMHITPYEMANRFAIEAVRVRKLLLNKVEIRKLSEQVQQKGYTIVPLSVYLSGNKAKLKIGLAKGKKNYDKRESLKKKDLERNMKRHE